MCAVTTPETPPPPPRPRYLRIINVYSLSAFSHDPEWRTCKLDIGSGYLSDYVWYPRAWASATAHAHCTHYSYIYVSVRSVLYLYFIPNTQHFVPHEQQRRIHNDDRFPVGQDRLYIYDGIIGEVPIYRIKPVYAAARCVSGRYTYIYIIYTLYIYYPGYI